MLSPPLLRLLLQPHHILARKQTRCQLAAITERHRPDGRNPAALDRAVRRGTVKAVFEAVD
jgi:hypothetical protein